MLASATKASAAPLCMRRESTRLCAQGKWGKLDEQRQRSSGGFEIAAFPLGWLAPWLPDEIRNIDGDVTAKGNVDMGQNIQRMFPTQIPGIFNINSRLSHFIAKYVVTNNIDILLVILEIICYKCSH